MIRIPTNIDGGEIGRTLSGAKFRKQVEFRSPKFVLTGRIDRQAAVPR
jgi:hypothetical protein